MQFAPSAAAHAADIGECTPSQLVGYTPKEEEVKDHRQFKMPVITYHGSEMKSWNFQLIVRIDVSGRVACYGRNEEDAKRQPLNQERIAFLSSLKDWHFVPFAQDGHPIDAVVPLGVHEEDPGKHVDLPDVPLDQVDITFERTQCYGECPMYKVEIHGDGRVEYEGEDFVDVVGKLSYRISASEVTQLIASLRKKDIWSLRSVYAAGYTDLPSQIVTVRMGGQTHQVTDYAGRNVGMPFAMCDFEAEIESVARVAPWIRLTPEGIVELKKMGFDFHSTQAAELLFHALANIRTPDDALILSLLDQGVPIDGVMHGERHEHVAPIDQALTQNRPALVEALLKRGALLTNGQPDQAKLDAAFHAAILGAHFSPMQQIWNIGGERVHPSLVFDDVYENSPNPPVHKTVPVTLLLSHFTSSRKSWDGLKIAKWLEANGSDLAASRADGSTLLETAVEADDPEFVRYLLSRGIDPSRPVKYGRLPIEFSYDEDIVLMLLRAGTDLSHSPFMKDQPLRKDAEERKWTRVVAWLAAHKR